MQSSYKVAQFPSPGVAAPAVTGATTVMVNNIAAVSRIAAAFLIFVLIKSTSVILNIVFLY